MVTRGGQPSDPLIAAFSRASEGVFEVEIYSSISSDSAGPATRRNVDNYVERAKDLARQYLRKYVGKNSQYVPGYSVPVGPYFVSQECATATVSLEGEGYFLPRHPGNLGTINAAALETARIHSLQRFGESNE